MGSSSLSCALPSLSVRRGAASSSTGIVFSKCCFPDTACFKAEGTRSRIGASAAYWKSTYLKIQGSSPRCSQRAHVTFFETSHHRSLLLCHHFHQAALLEGALRGWALISAHPPGDAERAQGASCGGCHQDQSHGMTSRSYPPSSLAPHRIISSRLAWKSCLSTRINGPCEFPAGSLMGQLDKYGFSAHGDALRRKKK